jgi:hypothetical protein
MEWRPLPGASGYEVSELMTFRVRERTINGRRMQARELKMGCGMISFINDDGERKAKTVRAAFLLAFPERACSTCVAACGEEHGSSKLTENDVHDIRALEGSLSAQEIGTLFGISANQVKEIWHRRAWRFLPERGCLW